jgi:hypothetical protein
MLPALMQDAVVSARDKERRKRRAAGQALSAAVALLVPGFCLPRALGPVLPIYLQGVLQVCGDGGACGEALVVILCGGRL